MKGRRSCVFAGVLCSLGWAAAGAAQTITSIAGNASADLLRATQTPLVFPRAVTADAFGFVYVGDDGSRSVRRIDAAGVATVVAGGGTVVDDLIPVSGKSAFLDSPVGLAFGPGGNLYIADDTNNRIRLLTPNGFITTVAGNGSFGFSGDGGPAIRAQFILPSGVAVDSAGNLYISDRGNSAIRKVASGTGTITTIAGGPNASSTADGVLATTALLSNPWGLVVDSFGNVFFADYGNGLVRKIEAGTGLIRTIAGRGTGGDNGPAASASLNSPKGVALAPNGDLYIGELGGVRMVAAATGIITTILGGGSFTLADGSAGTSVRIPSGISQMFLTSSNVLLIALQGDNLIAKLDLSTGIFNIVAGNSQVVGDGGPAATAAVAQPNKMALDAAGNLFFADTYHHRVRRVSPGVGGVGTGTISTVAGNGVAGASNVDGPALSTAIGFPTGIFVDSQNNLYVTDNFRRVRRVGSDGILRTIVGNSVQGYGGDGGPATSANLDSPSGLVVDSAGNLYIADSSNNRVRKVDTSGTVRTIAGTGTAGFSGDKGPATAAQLDNPWELLLDGRGGLLVGDRGNMRVRRIDLSTGIIITIAGNGDTYSGDGGLAINAGLYVRGLALDSRGNLLVTGLNEVRRIDAVTGIISTVAGTGDPGFTGDGGLATQARLSNIQGIVIDSSGNIIFSDTVNNRIRRISAALVVPVLAVAPAALTFSAVQAGDSPLPQSVQITTSNGNLASASWSASARLNSGSGWLSITPASGVTPGGLQVIVNSSSLAAGTYTGSITITALGASNSPQTVSVTLTVAAGGNPKLAIDRQFLTFNTTQGGGNPPSQTLALTNGGGGVLQWSSAVQTSNGGDWLTISPPSGAGAATLTVSAALGALPVGVYQGLLLLTNRTTGQVAALAVSFIVSQPVSSLLLSQTGALLTVNAGGTFVPPVIPQVVNTGQGTMNWQAQAVSLSGGNWLNVTPSSGSSAAGSGAGLTLTTSPAGLAAGVYDALVTVTAPGSSNSPQVLLARLNVQSAGTPPVGAIQPGGIGLVGASGGPIQQGIFTVSSSGGSTLTYAASANTSDGKAWLSVQPSGGSLQGSAQSATLTVQASPAQLAAGVYRGKVTVSFNTGVTQDVSILLVVTPAGTTPAAVHAAAAGCPTKLVPLETALLNNFSLPTGWPTPLLVQVWDDCGSLVKNSTVYATFTNGESPLPLRANGNGLYTGTWNANKSGNVTITATATGSGLSGTSDPLAGSVGASGPPGSATALIFRNGVVHGATFNRLDQGKQFAPLAPGQIFSLFGQNLQNSATGVAVAGSLPLPTVLGGLTAKMAGKDVPLYYANNGQVNAQIPFEFNPGDTLPLVITIRNTASPPELVTLTNTQPGIFTVDSSGSGVGVITRADASLVTGSNPAHPGDVVVIYSTGLGVTNPSVTTGTASPFNPVARVPDAVSVYIGGIQVTAEFAGLTPGLVGLYQVNARIPASVQTGDAVEVYLQHKQINSNKVTLTIR